MNVRKRIRVLINALRLAEGSCRHLGGNYFHTQYLAQALAAADQIDLVLLADEYTFEPLKQSVSNCEVVYQPLNGGSIVAADLAVIRSVRRYTPDIYHRTNGQLPFCTLPCRTVATIADVNFNTLPTPPIKRIYKELSFRWTAWKADRITCVSEFARREVVRYLRADARKISVIHHGSNPLPPPSFKISEQIRGSSFWVTFGHQPHKNVESCLLALKRFNESSNDDPTCLVVVGRGAHIEQHLKPMANRLGIADQTYFVGRVENAELSGLYRAATALLYVSKYEGFGLPVLEAMSCGCPVICSDVCSLPEVAGAAAILVSPNETSSIARAMRSISTNSRLRGDLVTAGLERASCFSWADAADRTIEVYRALAKRERVAGCSEQVHS